MSQDVSAFFADHIDAVRGTEGRALDRALSQLLRAFQGHIWSWANNACRSHGDRSLMHVEDVFNVISLELSIELRKELTKRADPPIVNFWAYFRKISQRVSFAYFHSGETTGFSSAGGAARRRSKINKTRRELTISTGLAPTDQEVIDEVNRLAYATRKDPKKQGALVTLDDIHVATFASLDDMTDEFGDAIWATEEPESGPLTRVEAVPLVTSIVDACATVSERAGLVANAWIGDAMAELPVVRTSREVATLLTLRLGDVEELLEVCKTVARAVCAEKYGIESPFA